MTPAGLPHSDIPGSMLAYSSPRLLAVNHVLLRLLMPRHPPYALIILTCFITQFVLKQIQIKLFFCLKSSLSKSRFLIVSYSLVKNCIFYLLLPSIRKISFFYEHRAVSSPMAAGSWGRIFCAFSYSSRIKSPSTVSSPTIERANSRSFARIASFVKFRLFFLKL